jgi:hypothetical protein
MKYSQKRPGNSLAVEHRFSRHDNYTATKATATFQEIIINYSWGNQQGVEHLAEAVYEGAQEQFLRGWFPQR